MLRYFFALTIAFAALAAPALAADPCSLITKGDAAKILGGPVTGGHRGVECTYRLNGTGKNVYVSTDSSPRGAQFFNAVKSMGKAVSGLGAPAYFSSGALAIMKGNTLVQVGIITGTADVKTMNPKLPALARLVLSRL